MSNDALIKLSVADDTAVPGVDVGGRGLLGEHLATSLRALWL